MLAEFESVAKKIQADFESSQSLSHRGVKGQVRETVLARNLLDQYLPQRYSVGSGLITDSTGQVSQQQDLVIYDGFTSPVLQDYDNNQVFFAEQVLATLEVKSVLDRAAARDVIDKAQSVGKLIRQPRPVTHVTPLLGLPTVTPPIVAFGFGYTSTLTLEQVRDEAHAYTRDLKEPHWPSVLLVLNDRSGNSGLVVNVDEESISTILLFPRSTSRFASVSSRTQGEALLQFYLLLMHRIEVSGMTSGTPDYMSYARHAGLDAPQLSIGITALSGTRFNWNGTSVRTDDVLRLRTLLQLLSSQADMSDDEILELFYLVLHQPVDSGLREGTTFFIDDSPWETASPVQVATALKLAGSDEFGGEHAEILWEFTTLIQILRKGSRLLRILDDTSGEQLFVWKGPVKES